MDRCGCRDPAVPDLPGARVHPVGHVALRGDERADRSPPGTDREDVDGDPAAADQRRSVPPVDPGAKRRM